MSEIAKTLEERKSRYGDFRGHASLAVALKEVMQTGDSWDEMSPYMKESLDMIQHKIARILNGDPLYEDSWVDIVGYAQLALDRLRQDIQDIQMKVAFNAEAMHKWDADQAPVDPTERYAAERPKYNPDKTSW